MINNEQARNSQANENETLLVPEEERPDEQSDGSARSVPVWRLFRYADCTDVALLAVGCLAALLVPAGWAALAIFYGILTEGLVEYGRNSTAPGAVSDLTYAVNVFSIGMGACAGEIFIFSSLFAFCFNYAAARQVRRIRQLFLSSALRQPISWFDAQKMGNFTSRISEDVRKLEDGIDEKLGVILLSLMLFLQGIGIAFYYGWKLSLVLSAIMPFLFAISLYVSMLQGSAAEREVAAYSAAGTVASEALAAVRTVAAFGGEKHETERYRASLRPAQAAMIRRGLLNGLGTGLIELIVYAGFGLAFGYGTILVLQSRQTADGLYTPGNVSIIFFSLLCATLVLGEIGPYTEALAAAKGAAAAVFDVIEEKSTLDPLDPAGERPDRLDGHIEFCDVGFSYPSRPDVQVLHTLSFSARPGQTVALVGSSGCGKTTCVQLIQRLYDPDRGKILLDGRDLRDLNVSWLRRQIGVVSQEPVLFSGTVADNIRQGCPQASDEDVEQAAREADAWELISRLPRGLETRLGAGGARLSGGQKQRLALARALVRRPRILLLDEATAALDVHSEAAVQRGLQQARAERTTVVVAHRLSTVRAADVICVLREGRLVEVGSHDQLMSAGGVYHGLVTAQSLLAEEPSEETHEDGGDAGEALKVSEPRRRRLSSEAVYCEIPTEIGSTETQSCDSEEDLPVVSRRRLLAVNRAEWPYILLGVLASAVLGALSPGLAIIYGLMLKNLATADQEVMLHMSRLCAVAICVLGAGICIGYSVQLVPVRQMWAFAASGERLTSRLRVGLFSSLLHQEPSFHDMPGHSVGALTGWLSDDAAKVQAATGSRVGQLAGAAFSVVFGTALSLWLSWRVSLAVAAFVPLGLLCAVLEHQGTENSRELARGEQQRANELAVEALSNIRTVAALGMEEDVARRFRQILDGQSRREFWRALRRGLVLGFADAFPLLGNVVLFQVGRLELLKGRVSFPALFMISETLLEAVVQMSSSLVFSEDFSSAVLAARRVYALMDRKPAIDCRQEPPRLDGDPQHPSVDFCQPSVTSRVHPGREEVSQRTGGLRRGSGSSAVNGCDWLTDEDPRVLPGAEEESLVGEYQQRSKDEVGRGCAEPVPPEPGSEHSSSQGKSLCHISMDRVTFRYPARPEVTVLRDFNLEIAPGQTVALVGASGCGKSTCVQLLLRFYDPEKGSVMVDNEALTEAHLSRHRARVGIVSQEPILFNRTIRENIAYGDTSREVSMQEVEAAARAANIHQFVTSLPAGYETQLGSSGSTQLSGGQKQRVAIARALVRRPAVLLLDEATSALDAESEKCVQEALDRAASGRTCLVIAHRLSTIQGADLILVMHRGRVVEQGTHQQLLALRGRYHRMCTASV